MIIKSGKKLLFAMALGIGFLFFSQHGHAGKCIDVNKATAAELKKLDGIGEKIANAIINYRKQMRTKATKAKKPTWNFQNWATLMKVKGVANNLCQKHRETLCFSGKLQKTCPTKKRK